jgi:pyruvate formate lyase activating enzyme
LIKYNYQDKEGVLTVSKALIFSIEEFSIFDGPGIRTSVFLMGCPLRCEWCHNPEGQGFYNFIVRSPNGCIGCGHCLQKAETANGTLCYSDQSISGCPQNLLRYCAKEYTPKTLCDLLEKNLDVLNASGGGVTFSGGEPTASHEFLLGCLSILKGKTNRAIQTSGYCKTKVFKQILANCDYMLFDVKIVDENLHKRYTGVSNALILENFRTLAASGKAFVVRIPLIPTVTDTEENLRNIAQLLCDNKVDYAELLPYNKMAGSKYKLVGREYAPSFDQTIPVCTRTEIFESYGIHTKII